MVQNKKVEMTGDDEILLEELAAIDRELRALDLDFETEAGERERSLEWAQGQIQKGYLVESF